VGGLIIMMMQQFQNGGRRCHLEFQKVIIQSRIGIFGGWEGNILKVATGSKMIASLMPNLMPKLHHATLYIVTELYTRSSVYTGMQFFSKQLLHKSSSWLPTRRSALPWRQTRSSVSTRLRVGQWPVTAKKLTLWRRAAKLYHLLWLSDFCCFKVLIRF